MLLVVQLVILVCMVIVKQALYAKVLDHKIDMTAKLIQRLHDW